jgi:hypothetical protein
MIERVHRAIVDTLQQNAPLIWRQRDLNYAKLFSEMSEI